MVSFTFTPPRNGDANRRGEHGDARHNRRQNTRAAEDGAGGGFQEVATVWSRFFRHRNVLTGDLPAGVAVEDNLLGLDLESALGEQVGHSFFGAHRVAEVAGEKFDVFFVAIEF